MRKILDIDYTDLCLAGQGDRDSMRQLFENASNAGFDSMLLAPMICGKANYFSKVIQPWQRQRTHPGSEQIADMMEQFNILELANDLAAEYKLKLLIYFRLNDDFFPGLEEDYFDANPHLWWASRCGQYQFRGWPCYHYPEVRAHKLALLKEILGFGMDGVLFEMARSHAFYAMPHREPNFFGFNKPIADEMLKRTGVDIRAFDHLKYLTLADGIFKLIPYTYSTEYAGAADFDRQAWHWVKGEGFAMFLKEARKLLGSSREVLIQGAYTPPHPVALEEIAPANFYLDANQLAADGVINGVLQSANWSQQKLTPSADAFMLPHYQGVRSAGQQVGVWLNDIFSPTGGEPDAFASADTVMRYWETHVASSKLDFVVIHQADFITRQTYADRIWAALARTS